MRHLHKLYLFISFIVGLLLIVYCDKVKELLEPEPDFVLAKQLPEEAKKATSILMNQVSIHPTAQVLMTGPIPPGSILKENIPTELNPAKLEIPDTTGTYYVFFINDSATSAWFHPVRYAYVNVQSNETKVVNAKYWFRIFKPNQTSGPFDPKAYERINGITFLMVEGEGKALENIDLTEKSQTITTQVINGLQNNENTPECKKVALVMDLGEEFRWTQEKTWVEEVVDIWCHNLSDLMKYDADLMQEWLKSNDFDVLRYSMENNEYPQPSLTTPNFEGFWSVFEDLLEKVDPWPWVDPEFCCHEIFIYLVGHGDLISPTQGNAFILEDFWGNQQTIYWYQLIDRLQVLPACFKVTIFGATCYSGGLMDTTITRINDEIEIFCQDYCGLTLISICNTTETVNYFRGIGTPVDSSTEDFMQGADKDYDGDGKKGDIKDRFQEMLKQSYKHPQKFHCPSWTNWCSTD